MRLWPRSTQPQARFYRTRHRDCVVCRWRPQPLLLRRTQVRTYCAAPSERAVARPKPAVLHGWRQAVSRKKAPSYHNCPGTDNLQETQAYSTIGINPDAGAIYFLNRLSPAKAAGENWGNPEVRKEWLPALTSSSDHAWGFWNRANAGNLSGIRKIFSCMITNEITLALIDEALKTYPLGPGEVRPRGVEKWPGTTFPMRYDAAQALLGKLSQLGFCARLTDIYQVHQTG